MSPERWGLRATRRLPIQVRTAWWLEAWCHILYQPAAAAKVPLAGAAGWSIPAGAKHEVQGYAHADDAELEHPAAAVQRIFQECPEPTEAIGGEGRLG